MTSTKNFSALTALVAFLISFGLVNQLLPSRTSFGAGSIRPSHVAPTEEVLVSPALPQVQVAVDAQEEEAASEQALQAQPMVELEFDSNAPTNTPPPIGAVLHGVITSTEGGALESAVVSLTRSDGERLDVRSDSEGKYNIGPLPPGSQLIRAGATDFHNHEQEVLLPTDEALLRQDFVLRPQQVVRVDLLASSGEPALPALREAGISLYSLGLVPVATRHDPGETFEEVTGSLNNPFGIGSFWQSGRMGRPAGGPATYGTVTLKEDGPAWISLVAAHQVLQKQQIDPTLRLVQFTLDAEDIQQLHGQLLARVVSAEDGTPLAAQAHLGEYNFPNGPGLEVAGDGDVHFDNQVPGKRWLIVQAEGRATLTKQVLLDRGQTLDLGDLVLSKPVQLAGTVKTAAGQPIKAVLRWGAYDLATQKVSWEREKYAQSKADGSFRIPDLSPGIWLVQAQGLPARSPSPFDPKSRSLAVRVDASADSVQGIELVMFATTAITLTFEGAAEPWPAVYAYDSQGLRSAATWLGQYGKESQLHLPPGDFELVVRRDGIELERRHLTVGEEPQRIDFGQAQGIESDED